MPCPLPYFVSIYIPDVCHSLPCNYIYNQLVSFLSAVYKTLLELCVVVSPTRYIITKLCSQYILGQVHVYFVMLCIFLKLGQGVPHMISFARFCGNTCRPFWWIPQLSHLYSISPM